MKVGRKSVGKGEGGGVLHSLEVRREASWSMMLL